MVIDKAQEYGEDFNDLLESSLGAVNGLTDISIERIDFFGLVDDVLVNPQKYGITFIFIPCLSFGVQGGAKCSNPRDYLFWDGIHPTAVIHKAIGVIATDLFVDN